MPVDNKAGNASKQGIVMVITGNGKGGGKTTTPMSGFDF